MMQPNIYGMRTVAGNQTDERLADDIKHWDDVIATLQRERGEKEMELTRRLQERGATRLDHPTLEVQLVTPSPTYDWNTLRRLAAVVPPEELAKGFTPAHQEVVMIPDKWNLTKIKPLIKYGNAVVEIINAAMIPGTPRLKITAKGAAMGIK
jgi:hypothetical protein